jgi:hypothetical protein
LCRFELQWSHLFIDNKLQLNWHGLSINLRVLFNILVVEFYQNLVFL